MPQLPNFSNLPTNYSTKTLDVVDPIIEGATSRYVTIPVENIPRNFQAKAKADSKYRLISETDHYYTIDFDGTKELPINKGLLTDLGTFEYTEASDSHLEAYVTVESIDRNTLAINQLKTLGYVKGDRVFLRFFFPKWHDKYKGDKGRKSDFIFPNIPWQSIDEYQNEGRGCYFVVNGQGPKDEDVSLGKAIFYEHDDMPRELQLDLWKTLELPEPTIQIDTGGKSIHSYWVFDQPIPIVDWKALQKDLLDFSDADRSIKNESRVMRLAGAIHIGENGNNQSFIISNSGNLYNFDELRSIVPNQLTEVSTRTKAPSKPSRKPSKPINNTDSSIPSLDDIRKALGYVSPDCSYQDWVDIGMALHSQDIGLLGEWDRWSSGSAEKYKEGECSKKWDSFGSGSINIYKLFQIAKINGYKASKVIDAQIHSINIHGSSLTIDEIRNHVPEVSPRFTWDTVKEGFPVDITEAYEKANSYLSIEADLVALTLVTIISAEIGGICKTDTKTPLNINSLIVGRSGSGKSPKVSSLINGLDAISSERHLAFKSEEAQYKRDIEDFEIRKKETKSSGYPSDEDEPVKPTKNKTFVQSVTGEALLEILENQEKKSRGLLACYDEFKTFVKGLNKYNNGGDEGAKYLSIYSGMSIQSDTKSGGEIRIENPRLSILGGIQPETLMKEVNISGTEDGWWARYLLARSFNSKVVTRFDREKANSNFLKTVTEKYVEKIQKINGHIRSQMTEETIDLRYETEVRYVEELDIASNREAHLKTIDQIDRIAAVLSVLEYLYKDVKGDLAPVYPHHYRTALAICENSLSIWEELTHVDIEKDEAELIQRAYKIGQKKNKLDAKSLQNWAKGDKAQTVIKLVHATYGGNLATSRSNTFIWTP